MTIQKIIKEVRETIRPDKQLLSRLKAKAESFIAVFEKELARKSISAEVVMGGSFAKGTILKKDMYDIDILVRCDWRYDDLTALIEKPLMEAARKLTMPAEKVHGSRDYFRIILKEEQLVLEIIPVTKIAKPHEERNVTDLTYFHVPYVKRKAKGLEDDIRLAKQFCMAYGVYGAESYIHGFSGYALECLIINYKGFLPFLKALTKVEDRAIIDPAKHYKKKQEVLFTLNESKLQSPLILIDPTYKERNALAALNRTSFLTIQKAAKAFLEKPTRQAFVAQQKDAASFITLAKKQKAQLAHLLIRTNRQSGDIAGTKLKKFASFLEREVHEYFTSVTSNFTYDGEQSAELFIIGKPKKEHVRVGPPFAMKDAAQAFKKAHLKVIVSKGVLHAITPIAFTLEHYLSTITKDSKKLREMSISKVEVKP